MYVAVVPNRGSRPAVLLRESYRDGAKVRNRTLANLSDWPAERIETLRAALRGDKLVPAGEGLEIVRALPHGHVAAALGTARRIGLDRLLPRGPERRRELALALIVARLIDPAAKLATARALDATTATHSLGATLGLGAVTAKEVYATLDWLGAAQPAIETALAHRHLSEGTLVLYDVSSSHVEGRCCELARFGHPRNGRRDKMQIVFGLLCSPEGCPIAIEVFEGNTGDPATLGNQIAKLKDRFGLTRVVMVGDRGMITQARIEQELKPAGLDWITALRAPAIQKLAAEGGPLQPSLFDERDLAEIESPDFPHERLIVCKNPALAAERARKRDDLLDATERDLEHIQARIQRQRRPLRGANRIGLAVGALRGRRKVAKHFQITITDDALSFLRDHAAITAEGGPRRLLRAAHQRAGPASSRPADTVRAYKSLARVERAFRSLKTIDLDIRPVFHWVSPRVRAHVFLCMLAYHLEWHMRQALAPSCSTTTILPQPKACAPPRSPRLSPRPLPSARPKPNIPMTGCPSTASKPCSPTSQRSPETPSASASAHNMLVLATPTQIQQRAFDLLGLKPKL